MVYQVPLRGSSLWVNPMMRSLRSTIQRLRAWQAAAPSCGKRTLDPAGLCRDPETPQPIRDDWELLTDLARMNSDVEASDVLSTALRGHLASLEQLDVVKVDVQC
jgi:hypothetical protein